VEFLEQVVAARPTTIVAIQGYEPLLEEAWPYTVAIFAAANRLGVRTSLVTNGIELHTKAAELAQLRPAGVTVSLDSFLAEEHDRVRGHSGAFEATTSGLRKFMRLKDEGTRVSVNSVVLPRRRRLLDDMPELLGSLGIGHWTVTPVLKIGRNGLGGPVEGTQTIIENLQLLRNRASAHNVEVALYDELGQLATGGADFGGLIIRVFDRLDGLVRLSPTGACSVGREILQEVGPSTPIWRPGEISPVDFLDRALAHWRGDIREAA
jgi:MoaA/NifB/PqqE/SkfB family radical SAM enzyme